MNIDEQILKIIRDNTITENVITVSDHTEQENKFEVLCNHGFVVSKIKQSILKAIMEKKPKEMTEYKNELSGDYMRRMGYNQALQEFESVIKEILDAEPKKGTKNLDALDATNQNK